MNTPPPLRALSIMQPWATLLAAGVKTVENRRWRDPYLGLVALHASKTIDELAFDAQGRFRDYPAALDAEQRAAIAALVPTLAEYRDAERHLTGGVVGVARLIGYVRACQDPWHVAGQWGWRFTQARPLPWTALRGRPGLFEPPPDVAVAVLSALAEVEKKKED